MATIYIDNKPYEVEEGKNLLHVGLSQELDIPYFCWHPALGSVGACRLCAVKQFKDEEDTKGKLVMSCMTPVQDGMRVSLADPEASAFRETILEWLMVNHPHDCPVCDEGGECHLQDMTVMTGHTYREFRFKKRTYRNQYLGPLINHEMNRCIQCYRCVRFYNDYAGGGDLQVFAAHDHVYFGRHQDGVLESEFSGNLVEVCPTGVFTDKTLKQHYTRKWDLQTAPSVCVHCGVGCNTIPGERYGTIRRIRNRYNSEVNRYFLCDRGRYGYEFVNSAQRILQPLQRQSQESDPTAHTPITGAEALEQAKQMVPDEGPVIGIGSPRASLEANFALRRLVGPDRFYAGVSEQDHRLVSTILDILQTGPARSPSLHDMELADAVLVLGEDLTNTAPMMALAVRQSVLQQPKKIARKMGIMDWQDAPLREAIQRRKGPLFLATPTFTKLEDMATAVYRAAPEDIARLGFAVAHELSDDAPAVSDLSDDMQALASTIARALKEAERPLIVSGPSLGSDAVIQAAANVAWALSGGEKMAELSYTVPECNSLGLGLLDGDTLEQAVEAAAEEHATVIILENDLYRRATAETVDRLLDQAGQVIALDHLTNTTTLKADLVLPAATFAEGDGTFINNEGRAQRFYQVYLPAGDVQESWRWLGEIAAACGAAEASWENLDEVVAALARSDSMFEPLPDIAPPAGFRVAGQKIPRQPHRYSGRTAILANINIHEPPPPPDPDAPLAFTMEGYQGQPPPALVREYWAPGWNSVQAVNKFQSEVGGPLHGGDPGRRLFEPEPVTSVIYFDDVPQAFQIREDEYLVVPLHHIFGSAELSILTPGLAELAPESYLGLNPADATALGLWEGQAVRLSLAEHLPRLPVKLIPTLSQGIVGVPAGTPGLLGLVLPDWSSVVVEE